MYKDNHSLVTAQWRYIHYADGTEELYNGAERPSGVDKRGGETRKRRSEAEAGEIPAQDQRGAGRSQRTAGEEEEAQEGAVGPNPHLTRCDTSIGRSLPRRSTLPGRRKSGFGLVGAKVGDWGFGGQVVFWPGTIGVQTNIQLLNMQLTNSGHASASGRRDDIGRDDPCCRSIRRSQLGLGFCAGQRSVNSGINPPATRLSGSAAAGLRYLKTFRGQG